MSERDDGGTPLFRKTMAEADADSDRNRGELMRMVWEPTPWMVDVFDDGREREIRIWCNHHIGPESSPIHRQTGLWHRGNVTMFGFTWYGFATANLMTKFLATFGGDDIT